MSFLAQAFDEYNLLFLWFGIFWCLKVTLPKKLSLQNPFDIECCVPQAINWVPEGIADTEPLFLSFPIFSLLLLSQIPTGWPLFSPSGSLRSQKPALPSVANTLISRDLENHGCWGPKPVLWRWASNSGRWLPTPSQETDGRLRNGVSLGPLGSYITAQHQGHHWAMRALKVKFGVRAHQPKEKVQILPSGVIELWAASPLGVATWPLAPQGHSWEWEGSAWALGVSEGCTSAQKVSPNAKMWDI